MLGFLGLTVTDTEDPLPMKREAGGFGWADFLRSSLTVEGAGLSDLGMGSLEMGDLLALLRLLEDLPFAILKTWELKNADFLGVARDS